MERRERWLSLAIFFSFYKKASGADLTHANQICPCLELSISRQPHFVLCVFFLPKYDPSAGKVIQKNHQQIGKNLHPEIRPQPQFNRHPHPAHIKKSGQKTTAKESRHFSFQDFPLKGTAVKHKPLIGHKSEENGQNPGCRRGRNRSPVSHPAE